MDLQGCQSSILKTMKITEVQIVKTCPLIQKGNRNWQPIFVLIHTDEGITGHGEIGLAYGKSQMAGLGQGIDYARLILGMDPMDGEAIWQKLQRKTFWGMSGGAVPFAGISGIDIALWDIRGKVYNTPVYRLLGGRTREQIRCYASQIQLGWGKQSRRHVMPEEYAEAARDAVAAGYDAVKVDPIGIDDKGEWMGWDTTGMLSNRQLRLIEARVAAIREAGGEDLDIIIEAHSLTDANTAVQVGKVLEPFRIYYFEEPTQPLNPELFRTIRNQISIPLASGERIHSRWGFRPFLESHALNVIQPDLCNTGGITEGKKICDMAQVYDVGVQLHVCGGPISNAASMQLETVIPNFIIHETHEYSMIPENISLCKYDYQPEQGFLKVPELPGIGQEVDEEILKSCEVITVK